MRFLVSFVRSGSELDSPGFMLSMMSLNTLQPDFYFIFFFFFDNDVQFPVVVFLIEQITENFPLLSSTSAAIFYA